MNSEIKNHKRIILSNRQLCDIELIIDGSFNPLDSFLNKEDYESVLENMRLSNGDLWPIPVCLDLDKKEIDRLEDEVSLTDKEGYIIANMSINDIWEPDKKKEALAIFGTLDESHPGVYKLFNNTKKYYVGGKLKEINQVRHYDYLNLRHPPKSVKNFIDKTNRKKTIAFQTRNPIHRAHFELLKRSMGELDANMLIHPVVGQTKPGDINYFTRVNCYKKIINHLPKNKTFLSLIPLSMRMAGPKEALWHALIRKNYGCTHLIVGRDHAGPGLDSKGNSFYGAYDAQDLMKKYQDEVGIQIVPFKLFVYVEQKNNFFEVDKVPDKCQYKNISGTELRNLLENGREIPEWFTFPEVSKELKKAYPPKNKKGYTIFFTGLSGSGKSTIANALMSKLLEKDHRPVTLLDGDIVRTHLSSELGFTKEHRNLNITRIGFVASEITKNGGAAICAPIAPYEISRKKNRTLISQFGEYIEVHISTPIQTCEKRDVKGLYAKARAGHIKGFTGIDDPYESPINPELSIDTTNITIHQSVSIVFNYLVKIGLLND